jgi:hypothetical protein
LVGCARDGSSSGSGNGLEMDGMLPCCSWRTRSYFLLGKSYSFILFFLDSFGQVPVWISSGRNLEVPVWLYFQ